VFERDSVVRERQLKKVALLQGIGNVTPEQIHDEVYARHFIREGFDADALITTKEVLEEERHMLSFARAGRGELPSLALQHAIKRTFLSVEQEDAINGLLRSNDRLQIVRGVAGSGKTTLMQEAIEAMQQNGHTVKVLAPTTEAAYGVLHDKEGFDAHTLARFLVDQEMQAESAHGVIWVDEAGLVGSRDLCRLTQIAAQIDARIILSGDVRQHQPVARGQPLKLLESQAGITPFEIRTIRRQQGYYRDSVTDLSEGHIAEGVTKLQQLGFIREIDDDEERTKQLATDYADVVQSGKSALVIAPAHAERRQVASAIRAELKSRGMIGRDDREVKVLRQKQLTDAQKTDVLNYAPGDVIEFRMRGRGGFRSGDRVEVIKADNHQITGQMAGKTVSIPLAANSSFEVYEPRVLNLAKGDVIRLTKNRAADKQAGLPRLNNGSLLTIEGFTRRGDIKTKDGKVLPASWQHYDEGFTVTSYSSQGKTIDHVFVAQSEASFPASSPEQAYVSASRGKSTVRFYTDSIDEFKRAISKDRSTKLASELVPNITPIELPTSPNIRSNVFTDLQKRAKDFAFQQLARFQQWMTAEHPQHAR
jgi:ATP-dependent exoDNAse (exonuclease V) alpha subunit